MQIPAESEARADLAAAFRWAARLGMHESIANHFSVVLDGAGKRFLLNPVGSHFSRSRASELLLLDVDDAATACAQWNDYPTRFSELHFNALREILDHEEPDYLL